MKPKDLVAKLELDKGKLTKAKVTALMSEMKREATEVIESFKVNDDIGKFHQAVKVIRSKWDGVSNKIPYGIDEKQWNYFYASVIVPLRDQLCPTYIKRKHENIGKAIVYGLRGYLSKCKTKAEAIEKLESDEQLCEILSGVNQKMDKANAEQRKAWLASVNEMFADYGKVTEYIHIVIEGDKAKWAWVDGKLDQLAD